MSRPGTERGILRRLKCEGYEPFGKGMRFIIKGTYGPMRDGEFERARQRGEELARA